MEYCSISDIRNLVYTKGLDDSFRALCKNAYKKRLKTIKEKILVAAGGHHTCKTSLNGQLNCWGDSNRGQTTVPLDLGPVLSISAGRSHTCAVKVGGLVRCWGLNHVGQATVPLDLGPVLSISAGWSHTCAVEAEGQVRCWGANDYDQTNVSGPISTH